MKTLYESILDDEEQLSRSADRALIIAESIINSKTREEFNTKIELLKEKFDEEYGGTERDYYKALKTGQRGGKTTIFAIEKFPGIHGDCYYLIIETGPQVIHIIKFDPQKKKVCGQMAHYKGLENYCRSGQLIYSENNKIYVYDNRISIYLLDYKKYYDRFWRKLANI